MCVQGEPKLVSDFQAHEDFLLKCVISPDCGSIATSSADRTIKLWNASTLSLNRTLAQHMRWVWDVLYSADSFYVISASSDSTLKLWDTRNGDCVHTYAGHSLAVVCVALNDHAV